jgi:hexosaminidase
MRTVLLSAAILMCWSVALAQGEISIIPKPAKMTVSGGAFTLSAKTVVVADAALAKVLKDALGVATGYDLKTAASGADNSIAVTVDARLAAKLGAEGYTLSVTKKGVAIQAATKAGSFYGIQTLRQLLPPEIYNSNKVEGVAWTIPCVEITDRPRFEWRGMHLDVARHYMPPDFIRKYIDLMVIHKLNRFHLHLTDDQAWRIEIKKYPELTQKGSSKGHRGTDYGKPTFYTQDEMRKIVAYAARRHIIVIPEIETPGHSRASCGVHREWSGGRSLNLQPETISAFHNIFTEVMDIFPGSYFHIGGDEVRANWLKNEADLKVIEKYGLQKRADKIQEWLQGRLVEPIRAAKRRPVMWFMDQSWLDTRKKKGKQTEGKEYPISKDTIVMGWFDPDRSMRAAKAGYDVVMNPMVGTYFDYRNQRDSPIGNGRVNSLDMVYRFDPLPAGSVDEKTAKHILGTQGQLWSESMTSTKIVESKSFPRTCALAEVAWTPQKIRNYKQFTARMKTHYRRLDALDVNYYKLKTPMTVVATESLTAKTGEFKKFEWKITPHIKSAGAYRIMFDTWRFTFLIEVKNVQLTCNGKPVVTSDRVGNMKNEGKPGGIFDIKLPKHEPGGVYVLKAEIARIGKGKSWDVDVCIRKKAP